LQARLARLSYEADLVRYQQSRLSRLALLYKAMGGAPLDEKKQEAGRDGPA
jgi:hypothetical protein